jgi:hypothetical protein
MPERIEGELRLISKFIFDTRRKSEMKSLFLYNESKLNSKQLQHELCSNSNLWVDLVEKRNKATEG